MNGFSWRQALTQVENAAWALFLLALPVTSFPFFPPAIGGSALVRPLSLYPLAVLLVIATLPRLLTQPLIQNINVLLAFVCTALIGIGLSLLEGLQPMLGVTVEARVLRALITLALGIAFYLTVALFPRTVKDLHRTLRWLYAGFGIALAWGSLQAIYVVHFNPAWFNHMSALQKFVSTRRLFTNRISGMTYEPNWFAEQITFLLMPWLLASVLTNRTVFPWRWRRVTVESLLMIWGLVLLPFTFSRAGLALILALVALAVLFLRPRTPRQPGKQRRPGRLVIIRILETGAALALVAGLIYAAGAKSEFFARVWNYWEKKNTSLSGYFDYLGFGARFTYAGTAFDVFETHPWLGVGLGNYAFYFEDQLPDRPLAAVPEILRQVTPDLGRSQMITPKNIYLRLLSETGIMGTAVFMAFVLSILGTTLYLWLSPQAETRYWGIAGLLGFAAFFLAAFSFDSFALPNMWVIFGLATAAYRILAPLEEQKEGITPVRLG